LCKKIVQNEYFNYGFGSSSSAINLNFSLWLDETSDFGNENDLFLCSLGLSKLNGVQTNNFNYYERIPLFLKFMKEEQSDKFIDFIGRKIYQNYEKIFLVDGIYFESKINVIKGDAKILQRIIGNKISGNSNESCFKCTCSRKQFLPKNYSFFDDIPMELTRNY